MTTAEDILAWQYMAVWAFVIQTVGILVSLLLVHLRVARLDEREERHTESLGHEDSRLEKRIWEKYHEHEAEFRAIRSYLGVTAYEPKCAKLEYRKSGPDLMSKP